MRSRTNLKGVLVSLFLLLSLCACVREEVLTDIEGLQLEDRLVVHALLSPSDSVVVSVSTSFALGDSITTNNLDVAEVILTPEGGDPMVLPVTSQNQFYTQFALSTTSFPILAGEAYQLTITHPAYPAIQARCRVPEQADALQDFVYTGRTQRQGEQRYTVRVTWLDSDTYLNRVYFNDYYYSLDWQRGDTLEQGTRYWGQDPMHGTERVGEQYSYTEDFIYQGVFYPNLGTIGDEVELGDIIPVQVTHELEAYLVSPDVHLSRYQESQDFYARNRDALGANSFVELYRGIIPEYTNIEGGLGVFGAFLRSEPKHLHLQ